MASERSTRSPLTRSRLVTELLANRNYRKNFLFRASYPVIHMGRSHETVRVFSAANEKTRNFNARPKRRDHLHLSVAVTEPSRRHRPRAPVAHIAWTPPRVHHARSSPTRTFEFRARACLRRPSCHSVKSEFSCEPRQQPRERRRPAPRDDRDDPLGSLCGQLTPA